MTDEEYDEATFYPEVTPFDLDYYMESFVYPSNLHSEYMSLNRILMFGELLIDYEMALQF